MTNDRQTKNAASEGTSASHCSQARCECRDPRTVWNGTRKQWICDDCGKPVNAPLERTAVAGTLDGVVGNSGGDE